MSVNQFLSASQLDTYATYVDGPVLQEVEGDPVRALIDAATYETWVVDGAGRVRLERAHPRLSDTEQTEDEVALRGFLRRLLEEARR